MLYLLGSLMFEVYPVNITETSRSTEAGLVDKPVVGARPPVEFVGDGPETRSFAVKLFPEKLGGLSSVETLDQMRMAGAPLPLMRGDGTPLGWFLIEKATEKHAKLGPNGVGREVDVDLSIRRAREPSAAAAFASIIGLFQ